MSQKDFQGNTLLHIAVINKNAEEIKKILTLNPHLINEVNNVQETALHISAWNKDIEAIELLVKAGAKLENKDSKNRDTFKIIEDLVKGAPDNIQKTEACHLWLMMRQNEFNSIKPELASASTKKRKI